MLSDIETSGDAEIVTYDVLIWLFSGQQIKNQDVCF